MKAFIVMKRLMATIFTLLLLSSPVFAQAGPGGLNMGDGPKAAQPVPLNPKNWKNILSPQTCPNGAIAPLNQCGDGRDGFVWGWDSFSGHLELRPAKILGGAGAITGPSSMGGSLALTQNAWNNLYGPVLSGGINTGFRQGLTAYIPTGTYSGYGQISIATGSTANTTNTIRTLMGTCRKSSGLQQGILTVPGADGSITTNALTGIGSALLNIANTTCITAGMMAYDITNPTAIPNGITVISVTSNSATLSSNVAAPGVSNGDAIMFGFVIGQGGPKTWPGGAGLSETLNYTFTSFQSLGCLAALNSSDQCEILTQIFTNGTGESIQTAGIGISNPPYPTNFIIKRDDGGYGGL